MPAHADSVTTWIQFATHVFDSIWVVLGTTLAGVLSGWLLMKRPAVMDKVLNRQQANNQP